MTMECAYNNSSQLISNQYEDDSQTESINNMEIVPQEAAIGLEVEVGSTSAHDDSTDDEVSQCYDNMVLLSNTTSQENSLDKPPDIMVPAQQQLTVYSSKTSNSKNVSEMNQMLDLKREDVPVMKIKCLKSINNNGSIQENTSQVKLSQDSNVKTKKPVGIPVIKMNALKFNSNKFFIKRVNNVAFNGIKLIKSEKVSNLNFTHKQSNKVPDLNTTSNNSNTKSDKNLRLADVLQDKAKLTYIAKEVQQQMRNKQSTLPKEPTSIQQTSNNEPPLRQQRRLMSSLYLPEVCNRHPDLVELKDEELVKPGDTFASSAEFLDYTNARGRKWLFYYCLKDSVKVGSVIHRGKYPYFQFGCAFAEKTSESSRKCMGLRKRKKYKTKCPCRVLLKWVKEKNVFKVTHVCNHHDHEFSERMLANLPPRYRFCGQYKDMNDEIADLYSLDVDSGIIHRYLMDKTGSKFKKQHIDNQIQSMVKKNVQVQYSAAKLKSLLVKIKEINERFGPKEKTDKKEEQPTVSPANSGKPNKAFEELLDYKKTVEDREQAARTKLLENMSKPKRIRNRKKRPPVTDENEECIKKSRSNIALNNAVETEECNNKGRLERTLEEISYNSEVIQSIRDLQRVAGNETNVSPWSTRYLTGIDDSEEFSDFRKVYATTDSYDNGNELNCNQYDAEEPGVEIEIEAGNEIDDDHNTDNQEICDQHETNHQQTGTNFQEDDLDEENDLVPTSVVPENSDTLVQNSDTAVQDYNAVVQESNTATQDSNTIVPESNAAVQDTNTTIADNETFHKSKNVACIDMNELSEIAKQRIQLNSANFLDHYVNYVAEVNSEKEDTSILNELVTGISKRESEELRSQFMECCKIALQKLNNKEFANKETQVNMNQRDSDVIHQGLSPMTKKLQNHFKDFKGIRTRRSGLIKIYQEEIINRHNIETFIVQPDTSTLMESLSKKLSLPLMGMLRSIYLDKAILLKITTINQTSIDSPTKLKHTSLLYKPLGTENPEP